MGWREEGQALLDQQDFACELTAYAIRLEGEADGWLAKRAYLCPLVHHPHFSHIFGRWGDDCIVGVTGTDLYERDASRH